MPTERPEAAAEYRASSRFDTSTLLRRCSISHQDSEAPAAELSESFSIAAGADSTAAAGDRGQWHRQIEPA